VSAGASDGPIVTGISPKFGSKNGGDSITISGTGFSGPTEVEFGNAKAAHVTVNSDTRITAISPVGNGGTVVCVTVITSNGISAPSPAEYFRYLNPLSPTQTSAALFSSFRSISPSADVLS